MLDLNRLPEAVKHEGGVSRRLFLSYCAALAATPLLARTAALGRALPRPSFSADPFTLGLCSGDADSTGVVLWTRLAPKPLEPDGGMPRSSVVEVGWEIAEDEAMKKVVKRGIEVAAPELAHSVHVEVDGLRPDRWYWYRFRSGDATTQIARTRTLPPPMSNPDQLHFAFASCQHWESGYYTAYQHMAKDDLDLIFHIGDYIYEGGKDKGHAREHANGKCESLDDYRIRHAQYKTDEHLQAAHRVCPWFVTWDDHEVSNNYAGGMDGHTKGPTPEFLARRAAAYKAYYEHMPLRAKSLPHGPDMQLYRKASYGRLLEMLILDTRQYRTPQPADGNHAPIGPIASGASGTILGAKQKSWLKDSLTRSPGKWNLLAQQVVMGMIGRTHDEDPKVDYYAMDQWPGYTHERIEMVQFMADRKVANPIVITGDIHSNWVNELRPDDRKPEQPVVATEFVGTSISSSGDGVDQPKGLQGLMRHNPGVKYHNGERGYVRCTVTPRTWKSDYITVAKISVPNQPVQTRASFVVESGKVGVQSA
ncbi:MAG TPA: alkaline phosphatase D family protein [Tepidisphaeraceae bacterium]|nr:alkaline phosphatase D family protein [Tepidisphaeraceae bacterium]